jgi:nucleotide-binding universal stress UspA family protein
MATIKKILCAVDFSDMSKKVADYTRTLSSKLGAEMVVVFVAPSLEQYDIGFSNFPREIETFVEEIQSQAEENMTTFIQENFESGSAKGIVRIGDPAAEIIKLAKEESVDLIVMGTHGRKGIDKILFGSVAEKVVKQSKIPILTVRP